MPREASGVDARGGVTVLLTGVLLAGASCTDADRGGEGAPAARPQAVTGSPTAVATDLDLGSPAPVPDDPDPVVRAGAAGRFVACDGPVANGSWTLDFGGPPAGAPDPAGALEAFLDNGLFVLPATGYQRAAVGHARVLFTYAVAGDAKVAVIVANADAGIDLAGQDGWGVEVFATCDPAEYAPAADDDHHLTIWTDRQGARVATSILASFTGPEHCDWESVTFLTLEGRQYLRDPEHLLVDGTVAPYEPDAVLPDDAVDTGYRQGTDALWLGAEGAIAYLVTDDGVEAWPSAPDPIGCA